jgi:phosphate starvation-inducible membrane PsiE
MKRPPLYIFLLIPIVILIAIWMLTMAFELMRQQSDFSVVAGVVILFTILLILAIFINYIKTRISK